jgi:Transglycosylase-like domain
LGSHRKKSRTRIARQVKAAAPALAGVAAAVCLVPQALAQTPAAAQVTANHSAALNAGTRTDVRSAALLSDVVRAKQGAGQVRQHQAASQPASYTVRAGDSLSSIAGHLYQNPDAWPVLYWANHGQIRWANIITAGLVLDVPAKPAQIPAPPAELGPPAPTPPPVTTAVQAAPQEAAPAQAATSYAPAQSAPATTTSSYSGGAPGGSFGQCVVARESGGNAQVMNSTGHYGLYQFSASTWAAYGGNPASFGNASVAEQNQVFANALAAGGQSNWAPYDGC